MPFVMCPKTEKILNATANHQAVRKPLSIKAAVTKEEQSCYQDKTIGKAYEPNKEIIL